MSIPRSGQHDVSFRKNWRMAKNEREDGTRRMERESYRTDKSESIEERPQEGMREKGCPKGDERCVQNFVAMCLDSRPLMKSGQG